MYQPTLLPFSNTTMYCMIFKVESINFYIYIRFVLPMSTMPRDIEFPNCYANFNCCPRKSPHSQHFLICWPCQISSHQFLLLWLSDPAMLCMCKVNTEISYIYASNDIRPAEVHPCEKVIGIFFRHKFFIIYFLQFVLVFIHDICEVVNINCVNFCWISIIGYASVTFWKSYLGQNPMSR